MTACSSVIVYLSSPIGACWLILSLFLVNFNFHYGHFVAIFSVGIRSSVSLGRFSKPARSKSRLETES